MQALGILPKLNQHLQTECGSRCHVRNCILGHSTQKPESPMQATEVTGQSPGPTSPGTLASFTESCEHTHFHSTSVSEVPESQIVTLCSSGDGWLYRCLTKSLGSSVSCLMARTKEKNTINTPWLSYQGLGEKRQAVGDLTTHAIGLQIVSRTQYLSV